MRSIILIVGLFLSVTGFSQDNQVKELVSEGIELHDKGDFDGALRKYDEALKLDNMNFDANYEKSFTLLYAKRYKDCIDLCKDILKRFAGSDHLDQVYSNLGSAYDDMGKSEKAIEIYSEGLEKYPDYYLLHFNRGLTRMRLEKYTDAVTDYMNTMRLQPLHPSSNYYTALIHQKDNRIASLLAYMTFIIAEPESERSKKAFQAIDEITYRNIKKEGNNTTISISTDMLQAGKKKKAENDFGAVELIFSLTGTMDNSKALDSISALAANKFDLRLQFLINSLAVNKKDNAGFFWDHYAPFFIEMRDKKLTGAFSQIVYLSSAKDNSGEWVKAHMDEVNAFFDWVKSYHWN